jgi:hypothetical protein
MLWEYELYFEPNVGNPVVAMYVLLYHSAATEIFIFLARISAGPRDDPQRILPFFHSPRVMITTSILLLKNSIFK